MQLNYLFVSTVFLVHVLCSAGGMILLKASVSGRELDTRHLPEIVFGFQFIAGMLLYSIGFILWMYILSKFKLNMALPIAQSLFFIVAIAGSSIFLRETLSFVHVAGIFLCLVGIILIAVN